MIFLRAVGTLPIRHLEQLDLSHNQLNGSILPTNLPPPPIYKWCHD